MDSEMDKLVEAAEINGEQDGLLMAMKLFERVANTLPVEHKDTVLSAMQEIIDRSGELIAQVDALAAAAVREGE